MEKLNDFLKALIGLLLIISFVVTFSSCMKKQEDKNNDTTRVSGQMNEPQTATQADGSTTWNSIKDKVHQEEKELNSEMMELEKKASTLSGKVKKDVKSSTEKIKTERDRIKSDSLAPEFKEEWDSFKTKTRTTLDSLKTKLK